MNKNKKNTIIFIAAAVIGIITYLILTNSANNELESIKDGNLDYCPDYKISELVDNYVEDPEWSTEKSDKGYNVHNLTGEILYDEEEVDALIQFVIDDEDIIIRYFEIDKIEQNSVLIDHLVESMCDTSKQIDRDAKDDTGYFDLMVTSDFDETLYLNKGYPVMINFGSEECNPCKEMMPTLENVNDYLLGRGIIKFVDVWEINEIPSQFEISVIPTQYFYDDLGELYKVHEGPLSEVEIYDIFKEMGFNFN